MALVIVSFSILYILTGSKFVKGIFQIFYILKVFYLTVLSAAEQGTTELPAMIVDLSLSFEFCQFVLSTF